MRFERGVMRYVGNVSCGTGEFGVRATEDDSCR